MLAIYEVIEELHDDKYNKDDLPCRREKVFTIFSLNSLKTVLFRQNTSRPTYLKNVYSPSIGDTNHPHNI